MPTIEYEFRITPPNQEQITDWKIKPEFSIVVAFEEGEPNGSPKLHYHGYLKADCSIRTIQRWLNDVGQSVKYNVKGNALFFTRRVHEHSFGYISKCRKCVLRHGTDQTILDEWYASSDQYKKDKATDKKRKSRSREDELAPVFAAVTESIKHVVSPDADKIIEEVLYRCREENISFPTKMRMEKFVIETLYPYRPDLVKSYFHRTFQFIV